MICFVLLNCVVTAGLIWRGLWWNVRIEGSSYVAESSASHLTNHNSTAISLVRAHNSSFFTILGCFYGKSWHHCVLNISSCHWVQTSNLGEPFCYWILEWMKTVIFPLVIIFVLTLYSVSDCGCRAEGAGEPSIISDCTPGCCCTRPRCRNTPTSANFQTNFKIFKLSTHVFCCSWPRT